MCLPLGILAAGLATGVGGLMSYAGEMKADHAQTRTFNAERARQKQFTDEQVQKFRDSLDSSHQLVDPTAQAAAVAAREGALTDVTKSADPAAAGYLPGSGSAPSIVASAGEKAGATADAHTAGLAHALATLGGFGDLMQKNDITLGRNAGDISQIGGFMRGSLSALQPEMDAAKQKGKTLRMLGGLAQSIGQAMLAGGAGGAGGAGSAPVGGGSSVPFNSGYAGIDGPFAGGAV